MVRRGVILLCVLLAVTACEEPGDGLLPDGTVRVGWADAPFPWVAEVKPEGNAWSVEPGEAWTLRYAVDVDLGAHDARHGEMTHLIVALAGDYRYDAQGRYRSGRMSTAVSSNFATTGLPVEYFGGWPEVAKLSGKNGSPIEAVAEHLLDGEVARQHHLEGRLVVEPELVDTPRGWYRPRVFVFARVAGVANPVHLAAFADNWLEGGYPVLPLLSVGKNVSTPQIPWALLSEAQQMGRAGVLPRDIGPVSLVGRSGFQGPQSIFIIRPAVYTTRPSLPTLFPKATMPPIDGGQIVIPDSLDNFLRFDRGQASCRIVEGPSGARDLGTRRMVGQTSSGPDLEQRGFPLDLAKTGRYLVEMKGHIEDELGRRFEGGGTYEVHSALPLTFSTSCKPGTSFLVGNGYPAKVNVNPPFPAEVEVSVRYFRNSDRSDFQHWHATGRANRFGHFVPHAQEPMIFDAPGEYVSQVTARYTDAQGRLWMGSQTSAGVVAPVADRPLILHGTRDFPYGLRLGAPYNGGVKRFRGRQDLTTSFLPFTPSMLPDSYVPYDPRDTLFVSSNGYHESLVEPHMSMAIRDPELSARLQAAYAEPSFLVPPLYQPAHGPWLYLKNVVQLSTDSGGWFPADAAHADELPILPLSRLQWHPFAHPEHNRFEAYTYMGVVRPGFPAMTSVHQRDAIGLYWLTSPNRFGFHYNNGPNGDLPGDVYRVQAGAVLKDLETGTNYYDAYGVSIAVPPSHGTSTAILSPGEQPITTANGREHYLFLATDTHDALEVGEAIGLGGMVFPAVEADVTWTVTRPSGEQTVVHGRANRLGLVRGERLLQADAPGIYRIGVQVRHGELSGDVVGTKDGTYWHCAAPAEDPDLLQAALAPLTEVDPRLGLRLPLHWPTELTAVRLHIGVIMPGQVLDQGEAEPRGGRFEYPLEPLQLAAQFPNFDVRNFATGEFELADTLVFQFFLEAEDAQGQPVHDALRLVLRGNRLYHYEALLNGAGAP